MPRVPYEELDKAFAEERAREHQRQEAFKLPASVERITSPAHYLILRMPTPQALQKEVEKALPVGWRPQGGLVVEHRKGPQGTDREPWYLQAMWYPVEEEDA